MGSCDGGLRRRRVLRRRELQLERAWIEQWRRDQQQWHRCFELLGLVERRHHAASHAVDRSHRAGGLYHSCALRDDTGVYCWGYNPGHQLGNGTDDKATPYARPVLEVAGGAPLTGIAAVVGGDSHTCALKTDGTVVCWGENYDGQLGNGGVGLEHPHPVQVLVAPDP